MLLTVPGSTTNQLTNKSNEVNSYSLFSPIKFSPIKYSTSQRSANSSINIFTSYLNNNTLYISNSTITDSYINSSTSTIETVNLTKLIKSNSSVEDFNYFVSNNSRFIILSTIIKNLTGIKNLENNLTVIDLTNNNTFSIPSNSAYRLGSITSLGNSSDIYFSFYNSTTFSIVRYNFTSNSFSVFFNSTNLNPKNTTTFTVNQFKLNNRIYVSINQRNQINSLNANTSIYILDRNGIDFNKTFTGLSINTFTPFEYGLLLYSRSNSTYYKYLYSSNEYFSFIPQFMTIYNTTSIQPFDNNTFIILNTNYIRIYNMNNNATSFLLYAGYTFNQNSSVSIQAFNLQGYKYYLLSGTNIYNEFEIFLSNVNSPPLDFIISIPSATTSFNPQSTFYQPTTYYYSSTTSIGNSILGTGLSLILSLIIIFVVLAFIYKKANPKGYNQPRNNTYLNRNQPASQHTFNQNSYCSKCGSSILPEDVFCQNCGTRI